MWELMDSGDLRIDNRVPQGPHIYVLDGDGHMVLREE
jgi:hypothetical protein